MLHFPPTPTWDSIHPLVIHFPIVLLLICPLFILVSAILPPTKGRPYLISGSILLLVGTCSLFIAAWSGEAAAELANRGGATGALLKAHEHLASESEVIFSGLTAILWGVLAPTLFLRRPDSRLSSTILPLAFLAMYIVGVVFLVNTAHAGGRLVHEFGVHAMTPALVDQSIFPPVEANSSRSRVRNRGTAELRAKVQGVDLRRRLIHQNK